MKRIRTIALAFVIVSAALVPMANTVSAATPTPTVLAGGHLGPGEEIAPVDGWRFSFVMQTDGNLVLYEFSAPRWRSGTEGHPGARLEVQQDGNLVIYAVDGGVLWASQTAGRVGAELRLQADGNVVYYGTDGAIWSTHTDDPSIVREPGKLTPMEWLSWPRGIPGPCYVDPGTPSALYSALSSPNGVYSLHLQDDANLVLYKYGRVPLWSTGQLDVDVTQVNVLTLAISNGDLQVRGANVEGGCRHGIDFPPAWSSHTAGAVMPHLHVQDDGNVVLYSYDRPVWQTDTVGR